MIYKLSRFSKLHHLLRRILYAILWPLPAGLKYTLGDQMRKIRLPYRLIREGDVVVQIGAPWDVLRAGRSRAIYFARRAGPGGRVVVVEPDATNINSLHAFLHQQNITNVTVVPKGAWHQKACLRFLSKKDHPASNLVEEVFDNARTDRDDYDVAEIEADTLDNMLAALNLDHITLLSVTSNGSEENILEGVRQYLEKTRYVSIIREPENYPILSEFGFELIAEDDRGYTFENKSAAVQADIPHREQTA